jgi:pseudouridine-5'-phosphate glycosidase
MDADKIAWSAAVRDARAGGRAVVALESTVIAQGLPRPENLHTARAAEAAVRAAGAVPATIGVFEGIIRIGLSDQQLFEISGVAATDGPGPIEGPMSSQADGAPDGRRAWAKANRRDLAPAVASRGCAATTVSATLWIARRFELEPRVIATGGLGGVHRDASASFDISTDLDELARADGALVVCSGMKSILDLPATLEALETRGVLVVGYRTGELPGFLTRSAGLPLEHRVDSPAEAAELVLAHRALGLPGAIVLAQPVPEVHALDPEPLSDALAQALEDARRRGIAGKPLTPFLLEAIRQATHGRSLQANVALLAANAGLAAEVAVELAARGASGDGIPRRPAGNPHPFGGRPSTGPDPSRC